MKKIIVSLLLVLMISSAAFGVTSTQYSMNQFSRNGIVTNVLEDTIVPANSRGLPVNVVAGTVIATNPSVGLTGAAVPTSATFVGFKDQSGNLIAPVLTAGLAILTDSSATTQPISAASLPLPTGASTSALQTTGNTSLGTIVTNTGRIPAQGAALTAASMPVNIASDQTVPVSAASLPLPTGAATSALQTTGNTSLASLDTKLPPKGAAVTAASTPVNIASDQVVPVSATSLPLPTGAATSALQTTGNTSLASIDSKITAVDTGAVVVASSALPTGAATAANQTKNAINTTASGSAAGSTVSTVATLTAPANAVGFILMNLDVSTTNMRWAVGRVASTTLGQQLQPGRDTGFVPVGANISIIAESGTVTYDVQWVSQ